ncbi:MAG: DUF6677 family protein [Planctomycetota bacterium]
MAKYPKAGEMFFPLLAAFCAWIVPGAGHLLVREKRRAAIIFAGIAGLFLLGLYIGSVAVIDPVNERLWYLAQIMVSPIVSLVGKITVVKGYVSYGRPNEIGQIYTSIAGMMNLLTIINVVYLAHCRISGKSG